MGAEPWSRKGLSGTYDAAGATRAPAIVFVHGAAGTRKMWLPQVQSLAGEYRTLALDLPGHGALSAQLFRLDAAVKAIADVLEREDKQRVLLTGLSLGGYVAIKFAHEHPERVAGLVLSGAAVNYHGFIGFASKLDAALSLKLYGEQRLVRMQTKTLRQMFPAEIAEPLIQAGFYFKAMPQVFGEVAKYDFRPLLRAYRGPVLILNGANDGPNRKGENALLQATSNGRVQIIDDAGHACNLEQPTAFTSAVRAFAQCVEFS